MKIKSKAKIFLYFGYIGIILWPMAKTAKSGDEKEMNFLEHLEELRWHIFRSLVSVLFFSIIIFMCKNFIFEHIILAPKNKDFPTYQFFCNLSKFTCFTPPDFTIMPRELSEQFITHLKVSFLLGIVISFPYIFYEIWRFIKPGLYPNEKKAARGVVFVCSVPFIIGILVGYYMITPFAVSFLASYSIADEIISSPSLASYVNNITMFIIPAAIMFELPVLVYFLSRIGIMSPAFMRTYRKHAIVIILIFAAIITPPEPITQIMIGIPVLVLYELSISISKIAQKRYNSELETNADPE